MLCVYQNIPPCQQNPQQPFFIFWTSVDIDPVWMTNLLLDILRAQRAQKSQKAQEAQRAQGA